MEPREAQVPDHQGIPLDVRIDRTGGRGKHGARDH